MENESLQEAIIILNNRKENEDNISNDIRSDILRINIFSEGDEIESLVGTKWYSATILNDNHDGP